MIGRNGERRSGISAQAARHDDDDLPVCVCVCVCERERERENGEHFKLKLIRFKCTNE